MAWVDFIDSVAPPWAKRALRIHWWGMFRLGAVLVDALIEGVYQGVKAGMPNAVDLPGVPGYGGFEEIAALDLIGRDRGVLHGLTEPPTDYAYRLRQFLNADAGGWESASLVFGALEQIAGVLGPTPPLMRIVSRTGDWWTRFQDGHYEFARVAHPGVTYNLDGTTTPLLTHAVPWDWDSVTDPPTGSQGDPGDWWLILYAPINTPYGTIDDKTAADPGVAGDAWDQFVTAVPDPSPWQGTGGTNAPIVLVELIQSCISQRAMAGFSCAWVIVAFDPDSFDPFGSSSVYPDGHWGHHSKFDAGTNSRIPARLASAEYWAGAVGGRAL